MKTAWKPIAAIAALLLVGAACGDTAEVEPTSPPVTAAPTTTAPTTTITVAPATTVPPTTTALTTTVAPTTTTSAPATTTTLAPITTTPGETCSAAGMDTSAVTQADLPAAVAETRQRIIDLAVACDFGGLAALAAEAPFFTFSFGGSDDAAAFWREAESVGDPVTRRMVEVLNLPFGLHEDVDPQIYAWPELATVVDPTDADYDQVRGIYDEEAIESFKGFGGYIGYRAGIQADGAWLSFVAGD